PGSQPTTALHQLPSPSPLLVFAGLQAQTPGELSQREGSNLSVLCPYPAEREYRDLKSWCRWIDQQCQLQVAIIGTSTYAHTERANQGYITIQGDPIHRNFSITMTDLQVEDSGTYYCAYSQINVPLKWISLTVFKGEYLFPTQTPVLFVVLQSCTSWSWTVSLCSARTMPWVSARKEKPGAEL
uniref:Ig-like domain-containing protein n=1 Tax=Anas platyrhynchos platyrhynchos TaxID=8840 RepID=A0A493TMX8_ANAPP